MAYYFVKVLPLRPTFPNDATEAELATMQAHFDFWLSLTGAGGPSVTFGPVLDPAGIYGVGIVETEDEAAARALIANDPAIREGLLTPHVAPMRVGAVRPSA